MSKLIPQAFIDDLLHRVDIVDIISSRVKLKRAGSNLQGLCPFHSEKSPSFTVSPSKQFFHCFGCSAHGSAIGFIMQFEHLSFVEAIENLASQTGLTVPKVAGHNDKVRYSELFRLTDQVTAFFEAQLVRSQRAIQYLKSRGLTGEICKKFRIGYAPNDWENLRSIYNASPFIKQQLVATGLLITKENRDYARFRDRITFPIYDTRGNIIGFGGRTISNDPAKYLNSPETAIYHKSEELYGLYQAKKSNSSLKSIIVVEGYLDVVSLFQFGITNVVATSGTAISSKQTQLLLRNTNNIYFCFDGDQAGRSAAWRALENVLPLMRDGIEIKFLFLPENEDPDSLVRKEHKEGFFKRLQTAMPLSDFFFKQLINKANLSTLDGRAHFAKAGKELLKTMPNGIFRKLLLQKMAELIHIDVSELTLNDDHTPTKPNNVLANSNEVKPNTNLTLVPPLQNAIAILLHNSQLVEYIDNIENIKAINLNGTNILLELIELLKKQPNLSIGAILEYWRCREEAGLFAELVCKEPIIPKTSLKNELFGIIQTLGQLSRDQTIQGLLLKAATEGLNTLERKNLQDLIATSKKTVEVIKNV